MALRDDIDADLATLWTALNTRQNQFFTAKGRYFQGLCTSAAPPADGATIAPQKRIPSDQVETWANANLTLPASMAYSLQLDVYNGPAGKGWSATVRVIVSGRTWERCRAVGPEAAARTYGWTDVTPEVLR